MQPQKNTLITRTRFCIWVMIVGLLLSGITAYPIETELKALNDNAASFPEFMREWLDAVYHAVKTTNETYPYLSYGTDWLAFAHLLFALLFFGVLKNPVKNKRIIEFGIIASIFIFFEAFIAGSIRGIPFFWRLIDCSFGVVSLAVLLPCYGMVKKLEHIEKK